MSEQRGPTLSGVARRWFALYAIALAMLLAAIIVSAVRGARAADHPTADEVAACGADVQRFCSVSAGAHAVVSCLQAHRASLSKACAAKLLEHGL